MIIIPEMIFAGDLDSANLSVSNDMIIINGIKYAIDEVNSEIISQMTYEELVSLPFETMVKLSSSLEMSIDELLKMKVAVSSKAASTVREQPNILTVITDEQIKKSGFHDLMSILQTVPGIFFGSDVSGVIGIGMRGIWGQEGKILLLIDGQEINEPRYAGVPFFNHFDVEQIKRIEIIRGSGSSIWGGTAELGVINIITKQGSDINGFKISTTGSYLTDTYGRENITVSAGRKIKELDASVTAHYGRAHKSDKTYNSFYFRDDDPEQDLMSYKLSGPYGLTDSRNLNAGFKWKDLSTRFVYDYYKVFGIDYEIYDMSFETYMGEIKYDWLVIPGILRLQPKYNVKYSIPWYTEGWFENELIWRHRINLSTIFEPHPIFTATGGIEYFSDNISYENKESLFYNNKNNIKYNNKVIFLEGLWKFKPVKITAGGRLEHNDQYGFAFAPRIAVNQVFGNFHYKLLFSKAFRSPGIGNLEKNPKLKPEETYVTELESGYKLHKNMFLTANFFDIRIKDPIYYLQGDTFWDYRNGDWLGSRGIEFEYAVRHPRINISANYSFYQVNKKGSIDRYRSSLDGQAYLGAPQHKVSIFGSYNVTSKITLISALNFTSASFGFDNYLLDSESVSIVPIESRISPSMKMNAGILLSNIFFRGMNVSLGINDIFSKEISLIQPYNGYEAPIPGQGRETYCKLSYSFKFRD